MRFGNGNVDGAKVKEQKGGNRKVVKTDNVVEDVVEMEYMELKKEVGPSAKVDQYGKEWSGMDTVVDKTIGRMVRSAVPDE